MNILFMVMSFLVFVMWAFAVFRTFASLRDRADTRTDPAHGTIAEFRRWLGDPAYKQDRRQLLLMTLAVAVLVVLATLPPPAASVQ